MSARKSHTNRIQNLTIVVPLSEVPPHRTSTKALKLLISEDEHTRLSHSRAVY